MLNRGFSLFEMLLSMIMTSIIIMSIITFYPNFHSRIIHIFQQSRLEEATNQAVERLIKDIRRAGFIANTPNINNIPAIDINSSGSCIILRYDMASTGQWNHNIFNPQLSDIFAYRFQQNSLESQTGAIHCGNTGYRWEKLFDITQIYVSDFRVKQFSNHTQLTIAVRLKKSPMIYYHNTYYIKNENR